ncbi:regulatory protein, tetR family [Amycolatopsis xylanica]|uniref:Regulatory protein, tetR family n=1 Tax=Amycolatopsis xylanica TaxID=589385 RepID=A0A1H3LB05_9PSEU|nr:TetR/AcrR family transcriptional regulator C-terminal domain-containing protein [Amycolatopsis xylanica]SDY61757.1 regulatory protein, tetR family [Amycolatopsis xylanica]
MVGSVWLTSGKGRKSRDSGLDRDKIVATAVRLLDAQGDVSMRALATELNVTPMSMYWYVANKDDLLELALDTVAGEIELPEADDDWQAGLRALAQAWRRTMVGHPWAIRCYGDYLNIGPNSMRFTQHAQAIIARSPLSKADQASALSAVFQYVYGFATNESRWLEYGRKTGRTVDEFVDDVAASVAEVPWVSVRSGVVEQKHSQSMAELRDRDFDRALDWLLAGMLA